MKIVDSPGFVRPMLASLRKDWEFLKLGDWAVEEKYDGERLVVSVGGPPRRLFAGEAGVEAWSRWGLPRALPPRIEAALAALPPGLYDGELMAPTGKSWGVKALESADSLRFVMFDVLEVRMGLATPSMFDAKSSPYSDRRKAVETIVSLSDPALVSASASFGTGDVGVDRKARIEGLFGAVRARGGEGLILKRAASRYSPGKRSKDWLKIKAREWAVMAVVGFSPSRGELNDRGPFAVTELVDDDGRRTRVKTLNDFWLAEIAKDPKKFVGRRLVVHYTEKTPDGEHREIGWDRWEDE